MMGTRRVRKGERRAPHPVLVVNVVIFGSGERILLTRRADCGLWCLPGGYVEIGESAAEAVVREVKEELGVDVSVLKLSGLYSASNLVITPPAARHIIVACFVSEIICGEPAPGEEVMDIAYFDRGNLPDLVPNHLPRIEDALKNRPHAFFD